MLGATHDDVVFGVKTGGPARERAFMVIMNRRPSWHEWVDGWCHDGLRFSN